MPYYPLILLFLCSSVFLLPNANTSFINCKENDFSTNDALEPIRIWYTQFVLQTKWHFAVHRNGIVQWKLNDSFNCPYWDAMFFECAFKHQKNTDWYVTCTQFTSAFTLDKYDFGVKREHFTKPLSKQNAQQMDCMTKEIWCHHTHFVPWLCTV